LRSDRAAASETLDNIQRFHDVSFRRESGTILLVFIGTKESSLKNIVQMFLAELRRHQ
jgi:hypothetical protein